MSSIPRWRRLAIAFVSIAGVLLTAAPAMAAADSDEDAAPADGAVEIAYADSSEIRPGEGWAIVCDGIGSLEGVDIACSGDGVTLTSDAYDPEWGTHSLSVTQRSGSTRIDVTYRVRLEPPPAPEAAVTRLDVPIAVGTQFLLPISALGITCAACTEDAGATIAIGTLPSGVSAGVSSTHLALRSTTPGDAPIPLTLTDDAGQRVDVELTVSFVDAAADAIGRSGALHVLSGADEWALADLSWGDELLAVCSPTQSIGMRCTAEGAIERTADDIAQLLFRIVDADGRMTWGSVTAVDDLDTDLLAVPVWDTEAPLVLVSPPAEDAQEQTGTTPLAGLAELLEGIPAS